jgi:hypothetical protein
VALAVSGAIVCMFVATVRVSLQATGISWREYFLAQRSAFVTAGACGTAAIAARVLLERVFERSELIAIGIAAAALVPWTIGCARMLRQAEFGQLRAQLPTSCQAALRGLDFDPTSKRVPPEARAPLAT